MAVCRCRCHRPAKGAREDEGLEASAQEAGVDTKDHVACVTACNACRWQHADVLEDRDPPPPTPPLPPYEPEKPTDDGN